MKEKRTWLPREIARRCIFCGKPPTNKNREHVLPKWLPELTGDPSRTVPVAFDWAAMKPIAFSWNAFAAPACTSCNDDFSKLEAAVKPCVIALLDDRRVTGSQIDLLLRWLDKVRVGLWLLTNVLGGGPLSVDPTFAIRDRIDTADRAVLVCRTSGPKQGLTLIGGGTPIFRYMPSCLGVVINGLVLINVSTQGLLGPRAGFPWIEVMRVVASGSLEVKVHPGTDQLQPPLVQLKPFQSFTANHTPPSIAAQWAVLAGFEGVEKLMTPWARGRLLKPGLSRPIVSAGDFHDYIAGDDEAVLVGPVVYETGDISRLVVDMQIALARAVTGMPATFAEAIKLTARTLAGVL